MKEGELALNTWAALLRRRASLLHQQIAALQRLVCESGGDELLAAKACLPYYRLLDEIYEVEMPIARALDGSDLLLHLQGEGLQTSSPRLSLVTAIMGDVRQQVGTMIKTLVSSLNEALELPREFEFRLSSFATGSLYLGFTLPSPDANFVQLAGDPLAAAAREALATLGNVALHVKEESGYESICREFADPKMRDAALSAISQLAPSGRRGVSSVALGGRCLPTRDWSVLTPQTRLQVRSWLQRPVRGEELLEFRGRVRAIDLDLRRFDLRRVDQGTLPDLRCIFPPRFDTQARAWLDATVIVRGRVESYQGAPRLVQAEEVTPD